MFSTIVGAQTFPAFDPQTMAVKIDGDKLLLLDRASEQPIGIFPLTRIPKGTKFYHWLDKSHYETLISQGTFSDSDIAFYTKNRASAAYIPGLYVSSDPQDSRKYGQRVLQVETDKDFFALQGLIQGVDEASNLKTFKALSDLGILGMNYMNMSYTERSWFAFFDLSHTSKILPLSAAEETPLLITKTRSLHTTDALKAALKDSIASGAKPAVAFNNLVVDFLPEAVVTEVFDQQPKKIKFSILQEALTRINSNQKFNAWIEASGQEDGVPSVLTLPKSVRLLEEAIKVSGLSNAQTTKALIFLEAKDKSNPILRTRLMEHLSREEVRKSIDPIAGEWIKSNLGSIPVVARSAPKCGMVFLTR
ncbi:MAG: hypothetical protein V4736_01540 [Bdellovibrionota bacterium]